MKENDTAWAELNRKVLEESANSNWNEVSMCYREMAIIVAKEGKDSLHLLKESFKFTIKNYKENGIKKVMVITARDEKVCEACKKLEGKIMTIEEYETCPLPPKDCTGSIYKTKGHYCRCCISSVVGISS